MSSKALPCPFCGELHASTVEGDTFRWLAVQCLSCAARGPDVRVQTAGDGSLEEWRAEADERAIKEWNTRAAPVPVPEASGVYYEFVISDADDCTQAGGIAPTYAQALSEGQHYLAQYQQDGPHTLELRRVEVLPPGALPEQRYPAPVPVSERLPGTEDCLDEGWAWFFSPRVGWRQAVLPVSAAYTHWLPAHALPLPSMEVEK